MARRILHIIPTLNRCGAARQLSLLVRGLDRAEFAPEVCVLGGDERSRDVAELGAELGVPVTVLRQRWRVDPLALGQLVAHVRRVRPALVHTWGAAGADYARLASSMTGGARMVVDVSEFGAGANGLAGRLARFDGRRIDRLVANCDAVLEQAEKQRLPTERWAVISQGVPPARRSDRTREALFEELDLPADARLIGAIGRLVPRRRTTELIWAADLLRVLHDNMRLLVIGDGPERPQLERFARLASDLDHVRFLGERRDVWRILPHLDVLWQEGSRLKLPYVVMEAMAAGVPVVASDAPAHRELVVDGETGYLVPVAARAARVRYTDGLLSDRTLAHALGEAGRRRMAEHYPLRRMIDAYAQLYREVLGT